MPPLCPTPVWPQRGHCSMAKQQLCCKHPEPFQEEQTAIFSSLFCICPMFMLTAFTPLQGGMPRTRPCSALPHCHSAPKPLQLTAWHGQAKQQTPSCCSSAECGSHAPPHRAPAGQDAAMQAGRAPVSPSIRGNAWAHDRGSQEGLKEAGGQQRFRKRLCSLSRNVAKALIP